MAISTSATARSAIAAVGVIFLAIATQAGWTGQSALAEEAPPVAPAPSIVAGGGVTLDSVNLNFPRTDRTFPGGAGADTINNDCLICHSAGMVLTQPSLSRAGWQGLVNQMRNGSARRSPSTTDSAGRRIRTRPRARERYGCAPAIAAPRSHRSSARCRDPAEHGPPPRSPLPGTKGAARRRPFVCYARHGAIAVDWRAGSGVGEQGTVCTGLAAGGGSQVRTRL